MVRLSLVNMYLHGFNTPQIYEYDTLTSTDRWNEYSNVILANPPFMTPKGGIRPHQKFTIQAKRSEVLFVDYMLEHLTNNGRAGIIVPEGIVFKGDNAYKQLRKMMIEENYLVGVISLPAGVFNPYSGVKTSILWIDKALAKKTDKIIFLKINNDGFDLGAQRRPIETNDLPATFASAMAFKESVLSGAEFKAPDKDVILVEKTKLTDSEEFNLSGERYGDTLRAQTSLFDLVSIGDICDLYQPQTITGKDLQEDGEYPVFGANGIIGRYHSFNHPESEVVITCRGATCGTINRTLPKSWITGNAMVARPKSDQLSKQFLYYCLMYSDLSSTISGSAQPQITRSSLAPYKIPLPPLSVQEEIVAELDSYQKIIDGAKQVVDNWKPHIETDPNWDMVKLKELCTFEYGKGLPEKDRISGPYPVLGSNGVAGYHNSSFVKGPVIVVGRKGSAGEVVWEDRDCCPIDTTFYVKHDESKIAYKYLYYVLKMANLQNLRGGTGIPGLNRNDAYEVLIRLPNLSTQHTILQRISREEEIVNTTRELISLYNQRIHERIQCLWKS